MLHDLQRLIASRSWEGATDDEGRPMNFQRALEEQWPTGVGLTETRRERLYELAKSYPECKDMLADVKRRIDKLLPLGEHGTNQHAGDDIVISSEQGNSSDYTRRRLARDYEALYERVVAGELSANAAAIKAGFRKPTATVPIDTADNAIRALTRRFTVDELEDALRKLAEGALRAV